MKVYFIRGRDGTLYEPGYLTKSAARKFRQDACMRPPAETYVETLIVVDTPVQTTRKQKQPNAEANR